MNVLLNPYLASCACGWEITTSSLAEKRRREDAHVAHRHAPTADAVTALVTADPSHAEDAQAVEDAIVYDAHANGGEVDPNRVRRLIPSHVQPQLIGAVYNRLIAQGRLSQRGWTTNEDKRGRNVGKPLATYSYREVS